MMEIHPERTGDNAEQLEKDPGPPGNYLTYRDMYDLFMAGVVGTKEFRNYLAQKDATFKDVRDPYVDNEIDKRARLRMEAQEAALDADQAERERLAEEARLARQERQARES